MDDRSKPDVQRIGLPDLRLRLDDVLRQTAGGANFLVTSGDHVVAQLRPPPVDGSGPRMPGSMRGRIWMADDFDTLPPDILASMEGRNG